MPQHDLKLARFRTGQTGFENPGHLFDRYLDALTRECERAMTPRWTGRLGGADVFMPGHCFTMIEALRIDYAQPQQGGG